jgi:uncharacterized protein
VIPFRQFVLKVSSRCDLACDHCYVFEHADQSWRLQPKMISEATVTLVAERIAEHASRHNLEGVRIVLHGGEPLLAGTRRLDWICGELRSVIEPAAQLDLRVHTNGVLLDEGFREMFARHRVLVGISLDGDRDANDRHRLYRNGRSSYDKVIKAIGLLREPGYRHLYAGLLCTIDIRNDPIATYDALAALEPPVIDFLLPHATWDNPPPAGERTTYGDWLIAAHDRWAADRSGPRVRVFDSIISTTHGGSSGTEALGLSPSDLVVIETDGSLEQVDSLKTAYDGAPATGLRLTTSDFDEAARLPEITARQHGLTGLCDTCRACPVVTSCGGGLYAHRFRTGTGFNNPSVFCGDLMKIVTHVRDARSGGTGHPVHSLPLDAFDTLGSGFGDAAVIRDCFRSQLSITRTLLAAIRDRTGGDQIALDILARADDGLLAHPYLRAWAVRALSASGRDTTSHMKALAAAAAIRSGLAIELPVPVRDGYLYLPTLGRLAVGDGPTGPTGLVSLVAGSGWFTVRTPRGDLEVKLDSPPPSPLWQPVRTLRAHGTVVALEDTDPYRDSHQWAPADRLTEAEVAIWQDRYSRAWDLISTDYPAYAPGLAAGLTTITPLAGGEPGQEISAASRHAPGAIGAALPDDEGTLALLLIHEFQHVKLAALLDLFDLYDRTDRRVFYAPWRKDPRPLVGLLQGTYAHIAVTDYWRIRRRRLTGAEAEAAAVEFALWRSHTTTAVDTLAGSGALTSLGARFVDGMRATVTPWLDEPVSGAAITAAEHRAESHRAAWTG